MFCNTLYIAPVPHNWSGTRDRCRGAEAEYDVLLLLNIVWVTVLLSREGGRHHVMSRRGLNKDKKYWFNVNHQNHHISMWVSSSASSHVTTTHCYSVKHDLEFRRWIINSISFLGRDGAFVDLYIDIGDQTWCSVLWISVDESWIWANKLLGRQPS